ncbi:phage antirepressor KilAC domain-containing protein [Treponema pedis]|uniref:phage antirepressor KilAC domain-containing protein n=1 Tax=Treponema pedis TaxID=409322 RepID=UPI0003F6E3A8|nr:phage antirepressor KilAC domain-containing protein [Treponema pedis]
MIETKRTTKELADMLGVDIKTIQRAVISLGMNVERKGKSHTMTFNETQATAIKIELQNHSHEVKNQERSENMNLCEKNATLHVHTELRNKDKEQNIMTPNEIANILGVSYRLVVKRINEIFPNKMKHGKTTYLNEVEVTAIKKRIEQNAHLATYDNQRRLADMPKTNLEKQLLIRQAMQIQNEMIAELEAENEKLKAEAEIQKPKVEYFDTLISRGNATNIRNTAKELKIPERQFIKILQLDGFLYRDKHNQLFPYSEYVQKGYFEVKEWQQGEKTGTQTLITVEGKQFFINKYKQVQSA